MSSFTTPLIYQESEDGLHWKVFVEFDYSRGTLQSGNIIRVPKGFITDGASVPKIFWNILPPWGRYGKAAVLHDWLYACQTMTKIEADNVFLEAMAALGVGWLVRTIMYEGVNWGGERAWTEHQKRGDPKTIADGGLPEFPGVNFMNVTAS